MELGLYDIINRHQIYLEGLKANQAANFANVTTGIDELIRTELANLPYATLSDMTKASLDRFVAKFKKRMIGVYDPWLRKLLAWLEEYMQADIDMFAALYKAYQPESEDELEPTEDNEYWLPIWARFKNMPLGANGILPLVLLTNTIGGQVTRTTNMIRQGYASGWTPAQTVEALRGSPSLRPGASAKKPTPPGGGKGGAAQTPTAKGPQPTLIDGLLNKFNREARATTNTIIQAASVQANSGVASLIFGEYEWVSILDDRTTKICRRLDGQHWRYGQGPLPPAHVGCRSSIKPWEGTPSPDESFGAWATRQSAAFRNDAFDASPGSQYEGSKSITLEEFKAKARFILSEEG